MLRLLVIGILAACGRINFDPIDTDEQPLCTDGWCWEFPLPQGDAIIALHGTGPSDIWGVGGAGLVMHYDGTAWSISRVGTEDLYGVYAASASNVWICSIDSTVWHYDGTGWTSTTVPDDPVNGTLALSALWGSSPNDIWATSLSGQTLAHYDGIAWSTLRPGTFGYYLSIWGTAADDVWFVGDGTTIHWDGLTFSNPGAPTGVDAIGWGRARDDMWIADLNNNIHHYDGVTWSDVPRDMYYGAHSGWSPRKDEAWVGGEFTLGHGTSAGITDASWPDLDIVYSFWGAAPDDAWMATGGGRLYQFDGTSWTPQYASAVVSLDAIDGTSSDNLWAVGGTTIMRRDPVRGWQRVYDAAGPLLDVSVTGPDDVWVVGERAVLHWDGATWTDSYTELDAEFHEVHAIAPDDVWVFEVLGGGSSLHMLHFDGTAWSKVDPVAPNSYYSMCGAGPDVWIGAGPQVLHFEQGTWVNTVAVPPGPAGTKLEMACTGPNNLWLSDGRNLYHWDGGTLTTLDNSLLQRSIIVDLFTRGPQELWGVDRFGRIFAADGVTIREESRPTSNRLSGIWGDATGLWIVGESGTVMRATK